MDKREQLKSMLNNLINDKSEQAGLDFHNYLTTKMREVTGLAQPTDVAVDNDNDDYFDDEE